MPVAQYIVRKSHSWSLEKRRSTSPSQSLQRRYFSTSQAASPAGESLKPTADRVGRRATGRTGDNPARRRQREPVSMYACSAGLAGGSARSPGTGSTETALTWTAATVAGESNAIRAEMLAPQSPPCTA